MISPDEMNKGSVNDTSRKKVHQSLVGAQRGTMESNCNPSNDVDKLGHKAKNGLINGVTDAVNEFKYESSGDLSKKAESKRKKKSKNVSNTQNQDEDLFNLTVHGNSLKNSKKDSKVSKNSKSHVNSSKNIGDILKTNSLLSSNNVMNITAKINSENDVSSNTSSDSIKTIINSSDSDLNSMVDIIERFAASSKLASTSRTEENCTSQTRDAEQSTEDLIRSLGNLGVSDDDNAAALLESASAGDEIDDAPLEYVQYESELQMPMIMKIIQKDLSEPYSIYTYRYFIHNWPKLCFLAMCESKCVGAIVCKLDYHRKVIKRGYIAMLAVDENFRKRKIGSTLVRRAIEEMITGGADEVVLETEITNKPALKLYEQLGFVRDKRLFRYYLNGVDALRLKLWLR